MTRCLVTGAGGFIGGHLVKELLDRGMSVRAVDIKPTEEWWQSHDGAQNWRETDLRVYTNCYHACHNIDHIYNLAAWMGGIGEIETHRFKCAMNVLISAHMLQAAIEHKIKRFFYSSSACVYHANHQADPNVTALREEDALDHGGYAPEIGYGSEKLYTEMLCRLAREDAGLTTRIARFHNIYGPHGTWDGGREKAPAAICRKVAMARLTGDHRISIWGDGEQTRSFCWIDDCVRGILDIMAGENPEPVNLGSSELVSINQLVSIVEQIAGVTLERSYELQAPKGVAGRNSDNTRFRSLYGWQPTTPLRHGLEQTYRWVFQQVQRNLNP